MPSPSPTACRHSSGTRRDKLEHEKAFPLELIDKGIAFKCKDGKASFEEDKVRILKAIGDGSETLDAKVHGVVACAALRRALEEGGTRRETFLEAVRNGKVRKLQLSLKGQCRGHGGDVEGGGGRARRDGYGGAEHADGGWRSCRFRALAGSPASPLSI